MLDHMARCLTMCATRPHQMGVERVDGDLDDQEPQQLCWGGLPQHCAEGDHGCTSRECGVDQEWQVHQDLAATLAKDELRGEWGIRSAVYRCGCCVGKAVPC
jgi:hypothetical protein